MLKLPARPAQLGVALNTRSERHGEDRVAALDIPVSFLIEPPELCALCKSVEAVHRLFAFSAGKKGEPQGPALPALATLRLAEKIDGAQVVFGFKGESPEEPNEVEFQDAKLSKVTIEPLTAGKSRVTMTVQVLPDLDGNMLEELFSHMGEECALAIEVEQYGAQEALNLDGEAA